MAKLESKSYVSKNGTQVILTSPQVGQGEELLTVVKEIFTHSEYVLPYVDEFKVTVQQENEMIQTFLEHPDKLIITPMVDGKIVGMLDFSAGSRRKISHQGEFGMSLLPQFQGQGIGDMMLKALIAWASAHPRLEFLRLRVHAQNSLGIALYKKNGFVQEGLERRGVKLSDGRYDDVLSMARAVK